MKKTISIILVIVVALFGCRKTNKQNSKNELIIFHAGSLSVPLREISALFMKEHPEVTVKAEAAGSRHCARKITELGRRCDILASADYKVIDNLIIPEHADYNIRFAMNEMVIAYNENSNFSDIINAHNWYDILLRRRVTFGRSDPDSDPCGYRTLMVFQLAEKYYKSKDLANKLTAKDDLKYVRPKETDLLVLLEAGQIDYIVIYRSVAKQHGLKMIHLPDQVNLKSSEFDDLYKTAQVKVTGKKPGEFIVRKGQQMIYSVTIPKNAENQKVAEKWLQLLLSPRGQAVMEKNGQPVITPALADNFEDLPDKLKPLCRKSF